MKRAIIYVTIILLLVFPSGLANAVGTIFIDGVPAAFSEFSLSSGNMFVPIRPLANFLGLKVSWDERTRMVELSGDFGIMYITTNQRATLNGQTKSLARAPYLRQGQMFVPMRSLIEVMGGTVDYDAATDAVFVYSSKETTRSLQVTFPAFETSVIHRGDYVELEILCTGENSVNTVPLVVSPAGRLDFVEWIERDSHSPVTLLMPGRRYSTIVRIPAWVTGENYVELIWVDSTRFRGIHPPATEVFFSYIVSFRPAQSNLD